MEVFYIIIICFLLLLTFLLEALGMFSRFHFYLRTRNSRYKPLFDKLVKCGWKRCYFVMFYDGWVYDSPSADIRDTPSGLRVCCFKYSEGFFLEDYFEDPCNMTELELQYFELEFGKSFWGIMEDIGRTQ